MGKTTDGDKMPPREESEPLLHRDFTSEMISVRAVLAELESALAQAEADEDLRSMVEIVLAEILNNVVEHAYREQPGGPISLTVEKSPQALSFRVTDSGVSMPNGALPGGAVPDLDVEMEDLPEGGFGWNLIWRLTEDLHYERREGCNYLRFKLPVQPTA